MAAFTVTGIIKFMQAIGPIAGQLPAVKETIEAIISTFKGKDQDTLKKAYEELKAENTGGHARLQEMLRKAEKEE